MTLCQAAEGLGRIGRGIVLKHSRCVARRGSRDNTLEGGGGRDCGRWSSTLFVVNEVDCLHLREWERGNGTTVDLWRLTRRIMERQWREEGVGVDHI